MVLKSKGVHAMLRQLNYEEVIFRKSTDLTSWQKFRLADLSEHILFVHVVTTICKLPLALRNKQF